MIKTPHLYRVEAGPLGPAKRPAAPSPADNPVMERWRAVDGKPHLEQNDRGQFRTKDFMSESNNPYPSVPDKSKIEPMKPYFDPAVDDGEEEAENPWGLVTSVIRAELPRVLGLGALVPEFQRAAMIEVGVGLSKYWSAPMLRSGEERTKAINFGLDVAKSAYLRLAYYGCWGVGMPVSGKALELVPRETVKQLPEDLSPEEFYASAARAYGAKNERRSKALQDLTREKALEYWLPAINFGLEAAIHDYSSC